MKKQSALLAVISAGVFALIFYFTHIAVSSVEGANLNIEGKALGAHNVIEQKVPGEVVFVVIGVDFATGDTDPDRTRSDTLMLCKVNFDHGVVDVLSIPRDTQIKLDGGYHKINAAHAYHGTEGTMKALRKLLHMDIDYYVEINFAAVKNLVDAMGGVEVDSPVEMEQSKIKVAKGKQRLTGEQALVFVRARHPFGGSDSSRIQNQQYFIKTLMEQLLNPANIPKIPQLFDVYKKDVKTNIPVSMAAGYLSKVEQLSPQRLYTYVLPGTEYNDGISWYLADKNKMEELVTKLFNDYRLNEKEIQELEEQ